MILFSQNVFLDDQFVPARVAVSNGMITEVIPGPGPSDLDLGTDYLIPGLLDIHTHGAIGEDFSDGKPEGLPALSRYYARHGVTSFLGTTMTLKEDTLTRAVTAMREFQRPADGARCAGINLEGPFLSYARRGAQAAECLHAPDADMFFRLNEAGGGMVRLVTVAPEEPGSIPFIQAVSPVCAVSVGHTSADYDTARAAYEAGASHATHLFNAMPSLLHRAPGVIGAAFDCGAVAELICDGLHVHPSTVRAAFRLFRGRLAIISDSLRCTEMPDGEYEFGGQMIELKNGKATMLHTDTIAGSTSNILDEVRNVVSFGIPLEEAVASATRIPARAVRLDGEIGSIAAGKRADLVVLDPQLQLKQVYIDGESVF